MDGNYLRWSKLGEANAQRSCPHCGDEIELELHLEEIAVRLVALVAIVVACYQAKDATGGYVGIFATAIGVVVAAYLAANWRLRDKQRYRKGRSGPGRMTA